MAQLDESMLHDEHAAGAEDEVLHSLGAVVWILAADVIAIMACAVAWWLWLR